MSPEYGTAYPAPCRVTRLSNGYEPSSSQTVEPRKHRTEVPGQKTYEVKRLLKEHYSPRSSVIAERCKSDRRVQQEGQSVEGFIVELKHLVRK
ncbi:hypothetical protein HPB52_007816 [Rhipicephalus sanguineus]|uniref:Uncharacterized protein n=1 Tax=Rhipicephalus sanguineus TaxID=34632 RepID=A0A9D4PII0_RHISA|nr:hypothetical protein HPB52_007816 [Rhipicephalus sanguineus]